MEMCPYCGEEVPDDSSRCWKCGTEISEGSAKPARDDDDELEVPDDDDEPGAQPKRSELQNCPFCDSPMPKSAQRCKECGRTVKTPGGARGATAWAAGPWLTFALAGVAVAAGVGVLVAGRVRAKQAAAREVIGVTLGELDKRLSPNKKIGNEQKRLEVWENQYKGKYVAWSQFPVAWTKTPEGALEIELTEKEQKALPKGQKADCCVTVTGSEETIDACMKRLRAGEKVGYNARLVEFGGARATFTLDDGLLEQPQK